MSQRILTEFLDSEFFGPVFPGFQATQKIHAQNSRPELSAILSKVTFLNPKFIHGDFLLMGETNVLNPPKVANRPSRLQSHGTPKPPKVRKMPFWTPWTNGPFKSIKMS